MAKKETNMYMYAMQYGGAVGFSGVQYRPKKNPLTDPFPALQMPGGGSKNKSKGNSYKTSDRETLKRIDGTTGLSVSYNKKIALMEQELNNQFNSLMNDEIDYVTYINNVAKAKSQVAIMSTMANNVQTEYDKMKTDEKAKGSDLFMTNDKQFIVKDYKKDDNGNYINDEYGNKIQKGYKPINAIDLDDVDKSDVLTFNQATDLLNNSDNENLLNVIIHNRQAVSSNEDYNKSLNNRVKNFGTIDKIAGMSTDKNGKKIKKFYTINFNNETGDPTKIDMDAFSTMINNNYIKFKESDSIKNAKAFIDKYFSMLNHENTNNLYLRSVNELLNSNAFNISDISERANDISNKNATYYNTLIRDLSNIGNYVIGEKDMNNFIDKLSNEDAFVKLFIKDGKSEDAAKKDAKINAKKMLTRQLQNHVSYDEDNNINLANGDKIEGEKLEGLKSVIINNRMHKNLAKDIFERLDIKVNVNTGKINAGKDGSGSNSGIKFFSGIVFRDDAEPLSNYMKDEEYIDPSNKKHYDFVNNIEINGEKIKSNNVEDESIVLDDSTISSTYTQGIYTSLTNKTVDKDAVVTDNSFYITTVPVRDKDKGIMFGSIPAKIGRLVKARLLEDASDLIDIYNKNKNKNNIGYKAITDEDEIAKYKALVAEYMAVVSYGYKGSAFKIDDKGNVVSISDENKDELKVVKDIVGKKTKSRVNAIGNMLKVYLSSQKGSNQSADKQFNKLFDKKNQFAFKPYILGNLLNSKVSYEPKVATVGYNVINKDFLNNLGKEKLQSTKVWNSKYPAVLGDNTDESFDLLDPKKQAFLIKQAANFYNNLTEDELEELEKCIDSTENTVCKRTALGLSNYLKVYKNIDTKKDFKDKLAKDNSSTEDINKRIQTSGNKTFLFNILNKQLIFANVNPNSDTYSELLASKHYTNKDVGVREDIVKGSVYKKRTNEKFISNLLDL